MKRLIKKIATTDEIQDKLKSILKDQYQTYVDIVDEHMHERDALDELLNITLANQQLLSFAKELTSGVSIVYRGLNFDSEDDENYKRILETKSIEIRDSKYVSTSLDKAVAKDFAQWKKVGLILTIKPGTIIFTDELAEDNEQFGEKEIIIDMTDSAILEVESVEGD